MIIAVPIVSRLLFRSAKPGRLVQGAALALYGAHAVRDWVSRRGVRRIDFRREFGADGRHMDRMPEAVRIAEIGLLVDRLNDEYVPRRLPRAELARRVDEELTSYIASITGQRVETSAEVRGFTLMKLLAPFALGACDVLSGDVALFRDTGVFEPQVIAHEFAHRKGYMHELEAQALAYLALTASGDPVLVQAALCERLRAHLRVLSGGSGEAFRELVGRIGLRRELRAQFLAIRPVPGPVGRSVERAFQSLYDARMRLTGQNGLSDYDRGFTDFLFTFERSRTARQRPPAAGALHSPVPAVVASPDERVH